MSDEPPKSSADSSALPIEETPIIDPASGEIAQDAGRHDESGTKDRSEVVPEAARVFQSPTSGMTEVPPETPVTLPSPPKKTGGNRLGTVIFIILLFGLGVWLSS
ncbi:MAG: hypothetical protein AAB542_02790, partial [Patescibacteria group bacterium]